MFSFPQGFLLFYSHFLQRKQILWLVWRLFDISYRVQDENGVNIPPHTWTDDELRALNRYMLKLIFQKSENSNKNK